MNLFYIDHDPKMCAEWAVDSHCVKMILEAAQLLSTAHRILDGKPVIEERILSNGRKRNHTNYVLSDSRNSILYAATHINHPCAVWVREDGRNYAWAWSYLNEHCDEYTHRYGKIHKVEASGLLQALNVLPDNMGIGDYKTPVPSAMDQKYIISKDPVENYRNYYKHGKKHLHKWKNRQPPSWIYDDRKNSDVING